MKRYAKYLIGPAVIAVVAVLVMVNRNSVQEDIDRAFAKQLPVVLDGVEQIYEYSEEDPAYVEFDAQMRKKNGDVYDNHYAGMPLSTILESMDAAVQEDSAVTVTYADQYEIQLTDAEILAEGNVYLVTKENGEPLPEESSSAAPRKNRFISITSGLGFRFPAQFQFQPLPVSCGPELSFCCPGTFLGRQFPDAGLTPELFQHSTQIGQ